jgi:hypothetical protein
MPIALAAKITPFELFHQKRLAGNQLVGLKAEFVSEPAGGTDVEV